MKVVNITRKPYRSIKQVRKINKLYENITKPVTFAEITCEHFADIITVNFLSLEILKHIPQVQDVYNFYDAFSVSKDVSESIALCVIMFKKMRRTHSIKTLIITIIRSYITLYKIIWVILSLNGVSKSSVDVTTLLDYVNFILDTIIP